MNMKQGKLVNKNASLAVGINNLQEPLLTCYNSEIQDAQAAQEEGAFAAKQARMAVSIHHTEYMLLCLRNINEDWFSIDDFGPSPNPDYGKQVGKAY